MTVVGDGAVGKTTIVQNLIKRTSDHTHNHNGHKALENKKIKRTPFMEVESWNYKDLVFQCYDLAGQRTPGMHPLDLLQNHVLRYIDIYVFVFALDRYESFANLNDWLRLMNLEYGLRNNNGGFILVGNKVDLERNVSRDLAQTLVGEDRFFHTYVETSPIYGIGMDEMLNKIVHLSKRLLSICE